jgi:2-polyprenyl-6-methoxyphenol hydroxylase-like FAD-dependent oxidoreductase
MNAPDGDGGTCDVLVVGAGPTGLFLAQQLLSRGHSVRIVEGRTAQATTSRAIAIMPRTMEILRIAGLQPSFENAAFRVTAATIHTYRETLGRVPIEPRSSWFDYIAMLPQNVTERILLEHLAAAGGRVEYGTALVGLIDGADGVTVRLRTKSGEQRAVAHFVVGCDGANSAVRQLIGFGFEAGTRTHAFAIFDVDTVGDAPTADILICPHPSGPLGVFPINARRHRLIAKVPRGFDGEPTLDLANELIAERGPWNLGASKLHWGALWQVERKYAPGMHKGSIFLAGDAAHVHSPLGGQGLNAGLGDAFNLAWKLDYVLAGLATRSIFPSYSYERERVAKDAIRGTEFLTQAMGSRNVLGRALRDYLMPRVTENATFRAEFVSRLCGLSARYERSPIVEGSGRRAPDEKVRDGDRERRLYDVLDGRYLIVVPASTPASVAAAIDNFALHYGGALSPVTADEAGDPIVRLVRPDGYLGLEAALSGEDPTPVLERIARVLATHVRRVGRAAPRA